MCDKGIGAGTAGRYRRELMEMTDRRLLCILLAQMQSPKEKAKTLPDGILPWLPLYMAISLEGMSVGLHYKETPLIKHWESSQWRDMLGLNAILITPFAKKAQLVYVGKHFICKRARFPDAYKNYIQFTRFIPTCRLAAVFHCGPCNAIMEKDEVISA